MIDYLTQIFYFVHTKFALFKSDLKSIFLNSFKNIPNMTSSKFLLFINISSKYAIAYSRPESIVSIICWNRLGATFRPNINLYVCEWLDTVTANRLISQNGTLFSHVWRRGRLALDPLQNKSCSEFFSQADKNWHITWGNNLGPDWPPLARGSKFHTITHPPGSFLPSPR